MTPSSDPPRFGPAGRLDRANLPGSIELVTACSGDEGFLFELFCGTRAEEVAAWGWPPAEQQAFLQTQHRFQRESYARQYPDADDKIVLQQGERLGRMLTARTADGIALIDLAIAPARRNRGLGTALLQHLQATARAEGCGLHLHVLAYNPARRLYERLGFRENGGSLPYVRMQWWPPSADAAPTAWVDRDDGRRGA